MAKKDRPPAPAPPATGAFHNPFAALSGLRAALPAGAAPAPAAAAPRAAPAGPREAVLHLERKGRGGKDVTRVELRPPPAADGEGGLAGWLADLKRALGCGGAVEGPAIVLQGDQRERLRAWLATRGVRAR